MMITENTTFGQLKEIEEFTSFRDFIMVQTPAEAAALDPCSIRDACGERAYMITEAMTWLQQEAAEGRVLPMDIWSEEEKAVDPDKKRTGLLCFPGKPDHPYVVVCAGGAYVSVCNALEAFPTARVLTQKGYHVFALTYRVAQSPLLPKPQEDLAQAVRIIEAKAKELQILPGDYAVCGFSAGAHLAGSYGTDNLGYAVFGLPKPAALILAYPATSVYAFDRTAPEPMAYLSTMVGREWTQEKLSAASVDCNMSAAYPPTYLTHSRDDGTVPYHSSEIMEAKLQELHIPYRFHSVDGCDHGFSTGFGESEGWLDDAMDFFEEQRNNRLFSHEQVNDHMIRIQSPSGEYLYLVEGSERAALLDSGTGIGDVRAYAEQLTDKPIVVLLTHGHMDHALGAWRFRELYMNPKDEALLRRHSDSAYRRWFVGGICPSLLPYMPDAPIPDYRPITNGQVWDLGGLTIQAFECAGHTVGSVVFLLREDRLLMLGDACNSNTLVYDIPYATTIEEYRDNLVRLQEQTRGLYDQTFFSHEIEIKGSQIVPHMIALCDEVLSGKSDEEPMQFAGDTGLMAKRRNEQGTPADGSDVNFMYVKNALYKVKSPSASDICGAAG